MQYTTHYNLNLPEGTDIVNPLVQDNPNYSVIDTALYNNKLRVVGNATEIKSGTVHAITRSDSDIDVIRFTATGNWDIGDTMTVDGAPVSVYLPDGTAPLTGAYVINTEVVAVINGSRVTLQLANPYVAPATPVAADISYDNTVSQMTATDVQAAIDELQDEIDNIPSSGSHTLGGYVDIAQGTPYEAPKDGYFAIGCVNNASAYAQGSVSNVGFYVTGNANTYTQNLVFVRKGTILQNTGGNGSYWVRFYGYTD